MRNYQAYANRSGGAAFNKALNYGRRLLQPQYWPELRRMAVKRLKNESPDLSQAERARAYCASIARDLPGAFAALNLESGTLPSFAGEHADRLTAAQARIDAANARMGGGADLDLLYALCVCSEARRVLETGVAFGWSTLAILSALEERRDGRLISSVVARFGATPVFGSSSRGGAAALRGMIEAVNAGHPVLITPDGPRGPRRVAAPGAAQLAAMTGCRLVAGSAAVSRAVVLSSWDRMMIPLPFGRGVVVIGDVIDVPPDGAAAAIEHMSAAMSEACERADAAVGR